MKTVFIDTSVISECHRQGVTANDLNNVLRANKLIPVVGVYVTFEVARNIVTENPTKASQLFSFIRELKPEFSCRRADLYIKEAEKIKHGTPVEYLLGAGDVIHKKIEDYSDGKFNTLHEEFVTTRQSLLTKTRQTLWRPSGGGKFKKLYQGNFDKFRADYFKNLVKDDSKVRVIGALIASSTEGKVNLSNSEIIKFVQDMRSYPAFRCLIYNLLYLEFLTETHNVTPAEDRFTDGLIMIEGSYCSAIVSCDERLIRNHAKNINPYIEAKTFKSLLAVNEGVCPPFFP